MKHLSDKYVCVMEYKGYAICVLKEANPTDGDTMGYVIDDKLYEDMVFEHPEDAMKKIDIIR